MNIIESKSYFLFQIGTTMTESPEITTKIVMTQRPPVITTQRPTYTTTKQPFSTTTFTTRMPVITSTLIPQFRCTPGSLDSRCKAIITSTFVPSTTTESLSKYASFEIRNQ